MTGSSVHSFIGDVVYSYHKLISILPTLNPNTSVSLNFNFGEGLTPKYIENIFVVVRISLSVYTYKFLTLVISV